MSKVIKSSKVTISLELNESRVEFIKKITGLDFQEGMEHFVVTCASYGIDYQDILSSIKENALKGYEEIL